MRHFFTLVLILAFTNLFGRCLDTELIWPNSDKINRNTIFIIEKGTDINSHLYTLRQYIIENGVYLKSGNKRIELEVIETFTNSLGFEQVVLKPKILLKPNTTYKLIGRDGKPLSFYNLKGKSTWTTNNRVDETPPRFRVKPSFTKDVTCYNEGPTDCHFAVFHFKKSDKSDCIIMVEILNKTTGENKKLFCFPTKNSIQIGISDCYFGYNFKLDREYEIFFHLIDSSYNLTKSSSADVVRYRKGK